MNPVKSNKVISVNGSQKRQCGTLGYYTPYRGVSRGRYVVSPRPCPAPAVYTYAPARSPCAVTSPVCVSPRPVVSPPCVQPLSYNDCTTPCGTSYSGIQGAFLQFQDQYNTILNDMKNIVERQFSELEMFDTANLRDTLEAIVNQKYEDLFEGAYHAFRTMHACLPNAQSILNEAISNLCEFHHSIMGALRVRRNGIRESPAVATAYLACVGHAFNDFEEAALGPFRNFFMNAAKQSRYSKTEICPEITCRDVNLLNYQQVRRLEAFPGAGVVQIQMLALSNYLLDMAVEAAEKINQPINALNIVGNTDFIADQLQDLIGDLEGQEFYDDAISALETRLENLHRIIRQDEDDINGNETDFIRLALFQIRDPNDPFEIAMREVQRLGQALDIFPFPPLPTQTQNNNQLMMIQHQGHSSSSGNKKVSNTGNNKSQTAKIWRSTVEQPTASHSQQHPQQQARKSSSTSHRSVSAKKNDHASKSRASSVAASSSQKKQHQILEDYDKASLVFENSSQEQDSELDQILQ